MSLLPRSATEEGSDERKSSLEDQVVTVIPFFQESYLPFLKKWKAEGQFLHWADGADCVDEDVDAGDCFSEASILEVFFNSRL